MRLAAQMSCLAVSALALGAAAVAEDELVLALLTDAPLSIEGPVQGGSTLEDELAPVFAAAPYIGVERSTAFRMDDRRRLLRDEAEPLTFADQAASGLAAFHLTVYSDPNPGRYAGSSDDPALAQAGLKVVDPEASNDDAICATLMTCLVALDAVSRQNETGAPIVVVIDARPEPAPEPMLLRVAYALVAELPEPPTWGEILTEIAVAVPQIDPERLTLVVTGGWGDLPNPETILGSSAEAVFIDGDQARVFRNDATPAAIQEAEMSGALTVVVGADWTGEGDPAHISPKEAAALGAQVVVVTPATARLGG